MTVAPPFNESRNVTLPDGVPPPMLATCAVKVTGASTSDGLPEEVRVVVVVACTTISASEEDALPASLVSPA